MNQEFQFHYGTIKSELKIVQHEENVNFNSTMVRLKVRYLLEENEAVPNFNSTMVRLKAAAGAGAERPTRISIPLWYD